MGRASEMHEQHRAICEALGDRAGVSGACCNLENCSYSTGDYGRARELHEQHRAISEALGLEGGVCSCFAGFTGDDCSECESNHYCEMCSITCDPIQDCSDGHGMCSDLGECMCFGEWVGEAARAGQGNLRGAGGPRGGGKGIQQPGGLLLQHGGLWAGARAARAA